MHAFFTEEESSIRDARKVPIKLGNYSLSVKHGGFLKKCDGEDEPVADGKMRERMQIARERFNELLNYFIEQACHRSVDSLAKELYCLPLSPKHRFEDSSSSCFVSSTKNAKPRVMRKSHQACFGINDG